MRKTGESKPFMHDTTLPVTLNDLSTNGTHVNMELVGTDSSRELHDGDKITLPGGFGFIFKAPLSSSTPAFDDLYTIMGEICAPMFGLPRMPDDSQPHSDNQQIAQNIERQLENLVERLEGQLYVKGDSGSKYVDDTPPYRPYRTTRLVSCVQKSTHRRYAVKKITKSAEPGTIGGKMSLQSHERMEKGIPLRSHERMEIGILMRVKHPQILCLWDTFNNSDAAYLVFDAEPKQTLSSIINKTGRVAERKGRGVLQQVFHAVQYLVSIMLIRPPSGDIPLTIRSTVMTLFIVISIRIMSFQWTAVRVLSLPTSSAPSSQRGAFFTREAASATSSHRSYSSLRNPCTTPTLSISGRWD